ncbi:ABC transporter substrate-binding protein [Brevibacillus sp. 179-C 1.1 NHS]|uniref:SgrR family transcriptional regulator n=1 Tax=Brevibacillus sp. 179-C 1.1 NHS TaxID=3235177 RepID=UPI0039A3C234
MQLVEQYIRLCAGRPTEEIGRPLDISLAEVAAILFCTLRNATLTLKKMQSQGWVVWQPGRGRGNRSVITCMLEPADLVLTVAKELVQKGEIRSAREMIDQYSSDLQALDENFSRWMNSQFGPRVMREKGNRGRVDTLRLFYNRPFAGLDPIHIVLRSESHMVKHLFDCLVRFDPVTRTIEPAIAFYWEASEEGKQWTFYLRKGVLFHHGRQLVAEDVRFSLLRLMEHSYKHRWLAASIVSIMVKDDHVLTICLHERDELFLQALSKDYMAIVPQDYVQQMGDQFAQMPVGTGPFRVVRNDDSMLVLEVFTPYFGGRPFLDRIEIWCVPGMAVEAQADETLLSVTALDYQRDTSDPAWSDVVRLEDCFQYVSLNGAKDGPLSHRAFRRLLASMISGRALRQDLQGARERAVIWGGADSFHEKEEVPDSRELARIFEACGYQGEALLLYTYPDPDHVEDAEWILNSCKEYGIAIEIRYASPEELALPSLLREADLVVDSANVDERAELSLREFLYAGALSISHHLDPLGKEEIEHLMSQMASVQTSQDRQPYVDSIMHTLASYSTFVPLYSNRVEMIAHPRLSGVSLDAYGWIDFRRIFVRE